MTKLGVGLSYGNFTFGHSVTKKVNKRGSKVRGIERKISEVKNQRKNVSDVLESKGKVDKTELFRSEELKKAISRARGLKVEDDISKLQKTKKAIFRKKAKSAAEWKTRTSELKKSKNERLQKRQENIKKYKQKKK